MGDIYTNKSRNQGGVKVSELITIEKFNAISFYQIPQAFYYHPKYRGMSASARETYAILRNLLSLSIQNNWVNEAGEIYVKISREKLMLRLGIKKDKMSSVFKELRTYELIEEKRVGCNKCNEIYLCHAKELGEVYREADLLEEEEGDSSKEVGENSSPNSDKSEVQMTEKTLYNKTYFKETENKETNKIPQPPSKQEDYKQKEQLVLDEEILSEFEKAFATSRISIKAKEVLVMFLRRFEKSVVLYAFELAGSKNKSFDYAQGILRKWWQAEAFTFDQVFAYEEGQERICQGWG